VSEYVFGVALKVALPRMKASARPPERRGVSSQGTIVKLFVGQGHGFIRLANDRDVFFHRADFHEDTSINDVAIGDVVTFELLEDDVSGARALRVRHRRRR